MTSDSDPEGAARRGEYRRRWYLLDNIARLFPPIVSPRYTTLFRVSARLTTPVISEALSRALALAWRRFPQFQVHLRRGVFWHYLEACDPGPPEADLGMPCTEFPRYRRERPLLRVLVRGRRIAVETTHILTDGTGALEFLRALLVAYALEAGATHREGEAVVPHDEALVSDARHLGVAVPGDPLAPEEEEYASRRFYERRLPHPVEYSPAWHLPGPRLRAGVYHVTTVRYETAALRERARSLEVSLTDFLLAVFILSLQEAYAAAAEPRRHRRPIRIMVPVNMRPHTGSRTMRNFFVVVLVEVDQRLGTYSLDEIARKVHHQLRAELDPRGLRRQITRNVRAERSAVIRVMPVFIKDVILQVAHHLQGERVNTASFSNLGQVGLPAGVAGMVESFDFLPPPSASTGVNMTVISSGTVASISFGSSLRDHDVERRVIETLSGLGLPGTLRTNWKYQAGV